MKVETFFNKLIREGTIERVRVNRYRILDSERSRNFGFSVFQRIYTSHQIRQLFGIELFRAGFFVGIEFRTPIVHDTQVELAPPPPPILRTITRHSYHSSGNGTMRYGVDEALRLIPLDSDGVRRSYGLEWEIQALTAEEEDKLARLLDTLPPHVTERDGSLSPRGVEIIFLPMSEEKIKITWNRLFEFCSTNNITMNGTGAHLTYGVSNSQVRLTDLQIRINRIALAVKSASTQGSIKRVFGRDFCSYAQLPNSTTQTGHSMSWSASRGTEAYELRLCNWQGNINKIVEFMKVTEFVFHRSFTAQDFMNIFDIMGSDCTDI